MPDLTVLSMRLLPMLSIWPVKIVSVVSLKVSQMGFLSSSMSIKLPLSFIEAHIDFAPPVEGSHKLFSLLK